MFIKVLKSKLHRARVTDVKLHYPGSIEIDAKLMETAGIVKYESVLIADLNNGNRFETYVVPAEAGSGKICVMGAAANLVKPKDILIIMSFGFYEPDEVKKTKPKIVVLDESNEIIQPSS
ncbi:MAG: aspartate 1-decarboxylase [Planctomycetota bacterium]|jgi:aspartate 1-decarboxylase